MQELTEKEIEIYTSLPIKIQSFITENSKGLLWVKSEYGFGYNLEIPHAKERSYWSSSSQNYRPWGSVSTDPNTTMIPDVYSTFKPLGAIPHNVDDIGFAIFHFISQIYDEAQIMENNEAAKYLEEKFQMFVDGKTALVRIEDETFNLKAETYRELALRILKTCVDYVETYMRPSITEIKETQNIYKENGQNIIEIKLGGSLAAIQRLNSLRYQMFFGEMNPSLSYVEDRKIGPFKFVEGEFMLILKKESSILFNGSTTISGPSTGIPLSYLSPSSGTGGITIDQLKNYYGTAASNSTYIPITTSDDSTSFDVSIEDLVALSKTCIGVKSDS